MESFKGVFENFHTVFKQSFYTEDKEWIENKECGKQLSNPKMFWQL